MSCLFLFYILYRLNVLNSYYISCASYNRYGKRYEKRKGFLRGSQGEDKPSPLLWTVWLEKPLRSIVGAMACPRPARVYLWTVWLENPLRSIVGAMACPRPARAYRL